jgi:hypothetical protein
MELCSTILKSGLFGSTNLTRSLLLRLKVFFLKNHSESKTFQFGHKVVAHPLHFPYPFPFLVKKEQKNYSSLGFSTRIFVSVVTHISSLNFLKSLFPLALLILL